MGAYIETYDVYATRSYEFHPELPGLGNEVFSVDQAAALGVTPYIETYPVEVGLANNEARAAAFEALSAINTIAAGVRSPAGDRMAAAALEAFQSANVERPAEVAAAVATMQNVVDQAAAANPELAQAVEQSATLNNALERAGQAAAAGSGNDSDALLNLLSVASLYVLPHLRRLL